MKLLILGPGESGKTTTAEYMRDAYGLSFSDSSQVASEIITPLLNECLGHRTPELHHQERRHRRELWAEAIALYNAYDATALARKVLQKSDVCVGMRKLREFEACFQAELFDMIIWCNAGTRVDHDPSLEITPKHLVPPLSITPVFGINTADPDGFEMRKGIDAVMAKFGIKRILADRDESQWRPSPNPSEWRCGAEAFPDPEKLNSSAEAENHDLTLEQLFDKVNPATNQILRR